MVIGHSKTRIVALMTGPPRLLSVIVLGQGSRLHDMSNEGNSSNPYLPIYASIVLSIYCYVYVYGISK